MFAVSLNEQCLQRGWLVSRINKEKTLNNFNYKSFTTNKIYTYK